MEGSKEVIDILVVDDRPDGLIALEAALKDTGTNVVKALSGAAALSLLRHHDFAVILLDVQMPGMDGFETAERIKSNPDYAHVPIVFVTAINKDERYIFRGYESGAVDYVFKPFEPQILRSKVGVFIDLHRKARRIREQESLLVESERKERFRRLAELEIENLRRYQSLADAIPHIVCRANVEGTLEYFNKVWTDVTGLSLEASVGAGWQAAFHEEDLQKLLRIWLDAMTSLEGFEAECRIRTKTNKVYHWFLVRFVPECRRSGEVLAWIGTATDIHDRVHAEEELRLAKEAADLANAAKTRFLANVSHEIRTPLSAILGFSELMLNQELPLEERFQGAATIRRNGEQLLHIINEILDLSKVEAGRLEIEILDVDFEQILVELRSLFALRASEKSLAFSIDCLTALPRFIRTDPTRLRQILVNVVANAVKFTERGGVRILVSYHASGSSDSTGESVNGASKGELLIRVEDTGIGIPAEGMERLFRPFSQVDCSTTRRFGGTGLGLALSQQLAQALGGDVGLISSELGRGAVFEIRIPADADLLRGCVEPLVASGNLKPEILPASSAQLPRLDGRKVLLVEDAIDNQVLISRYLTFVGAGVDVASNGREAVSMAESAPYDVVLMDIQMPEMDGYAATERLRNAGYDRPIIALTAHALNSEREKCLAAGFDDHLSKPIDRRQLVERIASIRA